MSRSILKAVLIALGACVALVALAAIGTGLWLRSAAGHDFLRRQIVERADRSLQGKLTVERLSGSLVGGVRLDGVRLVDERGELVARAASVTLRYHLWNLLAGKTGRIVRIDVAAPEVRLFTRPDGRSDLAALVRPGGGGSAPARLDLHDVVIRDGTVVWKPASGEARTLTHLGAKGSAQLGPETRVTLREAQAVAEIGGQPRPLAARGTVTLAPGGAARADSIRVRLGSSEALVDAELGAAPRATDQPVTVRIHHASLAPEELSLLQPSLHATGPIGVAGGAHGTRGRLAVDATVAFPRGRAVAQGDVELPAAGRKSRGTTIRISQMHVACDQVDAASLAPGVPLVFSAGVDLHGELRGGALDGAATVRDGRGRYRDVPFDALAADVQLRHRVAELQQIAANLPGAHVTGHGRADLDGAARLDMDVHVADASRLPDIAAWKEALSGIGALARISLHVVVTKEPGRSAEVAVTPQVPPGVLPREARRALRALPRRIPIPQLPGFSSPSK